MNNPLISALEPRLLFDGAAVATAVDVLDENSFEDTQAESTAKENSVEKNSIAFVDKNLKDVDTIVEDLEDTGLEVKLIDEKSDSVQQLLDGLENNKIYDEIHIYSHGDKGQITLGNITLSSENISEYEQKFKELSSSLSQDADILLYGCKVAYDDSSKQFVDTLANFTSADIATSDDLTGDESLNANWELEYETGKIEAETLVIEKYDEVLSNAPVLETLTIIDPIPTSSYSGPNVVYLFDDDNSTDYIGERGGGFTFDTGGLHFIDEIVFTTSNQSTNLDLTKYTLYGSNDGSNFTQQISQKDLSAPTARRTDYSPETINQSDPYRFYKIEFNKVKSGFDVALSGINLKGREISLSNYTEDGSKTTILDIANIHDNDSTNLEGATISIDEGFTQGDKLEFVNNNNSLYGNITSTYDSSLGILNLSGSATIEQYENALKAVTYSSTSNAPTENTTSRTFTWQVDDGLYHSSISKTYLEITPKNDAPQLILDDDGIGEITEGSVLSDSGSLTLTDPDKTDTISTTKSIKSISGVQSDGTTPLSLTSEQRNALNKIALTAGNSSNETINWTYTIEESDIDFIAEGEKVTVVYDIISSDGTLSDSAEVRIEILGKNDGIDLVVNDTVGDITEGSTLTDSGTIDYDDLDATDTVDAIFNNTDIKAYRSDGTTEIPLTSAQRSDLILAFTLPSAGGNNKGSIQWDYTIAENKLDFLSKDETVTLKYDIEISNNGTLIRTEEVVINITGSNDSPNLTVNDGIGNIQEEGVLSDSGTLTLTDVDNVDTTSTTSALSNITGYQSDGTTALTFTTEQRNALDKLSISAGTSNNETITWDYTVAESDLDFIGQGETVTLTYTITSTDENGASASQDVQIQITGANDNPVLTVNDLDGVIIEGSSLTDSGTIDYEDLDQNDNVIATSSNTDIKAYRSDGTLFSLSAQQQTDLINGLSLVDPGGSNAGTIRWQYSVPEAQINFLSTNESVVLKFDIQINNNGSLIQTQEVEVTINGTNDTPTLVVNDGVGSITEGGTLTDSGSLTLNDVDNIDTTSTTSSLKSITGVQSDGTTPLSFTPAQENALDKLIITAGTSNSETINWSYTISESEIDFIAKDEVVTVTYTITSVDEHGQTVSKDIEVNITGSNDIPTLTINDLDGTITEGSGSLIQSGTIDYNDLDLTDEVDASFTHSYIEAYKSDGSLMGLTTAQRDALIGAFSFVDSGGGNQGSIQWQYSINESEIDFLAQGESVVLRYDLSIRNNGVVVDTQQSEIVINGTNDSPSITVNDGTGNIQEGSILSDNGSISFEDVDFTNSVSVDSIVKSINGYHDDNSMMILDSTTQMNIEDSFDFTNVSTGHNKGDINWSFNISESELDFLAQNERVEATFTIRVTDSQGVTTTQDITVRIDGSNDAPVIDSKDDMGVIEESVALTDSGYIDVSDMDLSDDITTSISTTIQAYKKDGSVLNLTSEERANLINAFEITNGALNSNSGTITWQYNTTESNLDFLSEGESVQIVYNVQINDKITSIVEDVQIDITGTNDKPTVSSESLNLFEVHNGIFEKEYASYFTDVDKSDFLTYEVTGLPKGLTYDSLTATISGRVLELGTFKITITAYDSSTSKESVTKDFTMKVLAKEPGPRAEMEDYVDNTRDLKVDNVQVSELQDDEIKGVVKENQEFKYEVGTGFVEKENFEESQIIIEDPETNIIKDTKIVIDENRQIKLENYTNENYDSLGITIEELNYKDDFIELKINDTKQAIRYEVYVINEENEALPIDVSFDEVQGILKAQINRDVKIAIKAIDSDGTTRTLVLDIKDNKIEKSDADGFEISSNSNSFKDELKAKNQELHEYGEYLVGLFKEA